ncbi:MAG TPA: hypothetical protein VE219_01045, partial [Candidatus Sulfotelmatobacter sp.]|nr:hypothetical protein [Candidatus Sulfotelmatobacter sp.]
METVDTTYSATTPARPQNGRHRLRGAIFDLGGVMTEPFVHRRDEVDPRYRELLTFFLDDFRDVYHLPTGVHDLHLLETGRLSDAEFFERMCRRYEEAGHERIDPSAAFQVMWGRKMIACGAMVDAVRQIKQAGYRTALLTNISRDAEGMWRS